MQCPNCHFESEAQTTECLRCGIVFAKFIPDSKVPEVPETLPIPVAGEVSPGQAEARQELRNRLFALPIALLVARFVVSAAPSVRLLTMWVHEGGHAVTAWLSGFMAMPGPWFTSVSSERSFAFSAIIALSVGFSGVQAWKASRWALVFGAAAVLILQITLTRLYSDQAQAIITFGGDAGCLVLGSLLMMTFYARRDSALYQNSLRWGFLAIGAASFMDAYATWTGGLEKVPFGENENGMSDPSVLTELYGWPIQVLIQRYVRLAVFCLMVLAIVYVCGVVASVLEVQRAKQLSASVS